MSEPEYHIGKLIPIETDNIEKTARDILEAECPNYYKYKDWSYAEALDDNLYNKYKYLKGHLYEIIDNEYEDLYGSWMTPQPDGTIDYVVGFYNGGCCFSEALELGLKNLENG